MTLSRINERIDAAVRRASARYSSASFVFVAPNGTRVPLEAVKKDADVDALAPISGVAAARRFEFVVTRRAFDAVAAVLSPNGQTFRAAALLEPLRSSSIIGTDVSGRQTSYSFDASRPFQENSPDGGSVRFFVYEV